jgi:hypothetical protein
VHLQTSSDSGRYSTWRCGSKAPCTGRYRPVPAGAAPNEQRERPVQYMAMRFQSALYRSAQGGTSRCGSKRTARAAATGRCGSKRAASAGLDHQERYRSRSVGPVPAGTGKNQQSVDSTGLCQPVPAGTGGKSNARIMPALYNHIRWCIPKIFTIIGDRKSVGHRCALQGPSRLHSVASGRLRSWKTLLASW